jgi:hypothetical protein
MLLLGLGVETLCKTLGPRFPSLRPIAVAAVTLALVVWSWTTFRDGHQRGEARDAFAHVQANVEPGDLVLLDHFTWIAYDYYRPRFDFRGARTLRANVYDRNLNSRRAELLRIDGEPRVWLVLFHPLPSMEDWRVTVQVLEGLGRQVGQPFEPPGAAVHLFDLSLPNAP